MSTQPPDRSGPSRWTETTVAVLNRFGGGIALGLGALVLFAGLGSTGLWEPWEMDRADLSRTLAQPPEAVAALTRAAPRPDSGGIRTPSPAEEALTAAAAAAGVVIKQPDAGTPSALRATLDLARTNNVAAIVIDASLLVRDPARADLWQQAGKLVGEAIDTAAGGAVVVIRTDRMPPAAELASRLATERYKAVWASTAAAWGLDAAWDASGVDEAARALAASGSELTVLEPDDVAGLTEALSVGASAVSTRVAFKEDGHTVAQPPLSSWLRAATYRVFGASEWTTRLPGALLALIALWVLVSTVRTVWNARVALLTGVILATIPLFFAQARIIAGEPGLILALTLVGCGLLLNNLDGRVRVDSHEVSRQPAVSPVLVWSYLVAGLVIGLLSKGSYALVLFGLLALTVPLVSGSWRRVSDWGPALMFLVFAALVELAARGASPGSMWAGLGFESPLFSEGPGTYSRTFDMVIRQVGFGLAPWSPLVVVAVGLMAFSVLRRGDRLGLVVVAWFILPMAMLMASLKLGNQFLFAGIAAGAIAVALMIDELMRGEGAPKYFIAFALVCMFYIMRRELKVSPEPLVGYLAYDPPFAKEGNLRFPEAVEFSWVFKQSMIIAALACLAHFGRFASFAVRTARYLRKTAPFLVALGASLFVAALFALIASGRVHGIGMSRRFKESIQPAQLNLADRMTSGDPILVVAIAVFVAMLAVILLRWVFPDAGARLARMLPKLDQRARLKVWIVSAALWIAALVVAASRIIFPDDGYLSERLFSPTALLALIGVAILGALVWMVDRPRSGEPDGDAADRGRPWLTGVVAGAGALALIALSQLVRDSQLSSPMVMILVVLGTIAAAIALLPRIVHRADVFVISMAAVLVLLLCSWIIPLVDRAALVAEVVLPELADPTSYGRSSVLSSIWVLGPLLMAFGLIANFTVPRVLRSMEQIPASFHERVERLTDRVASFVERGKVLAGVLIAVGLVGVLTHLVKLEPAIAVNVSQKHILDTWREIAGDGAPIYKHGSFATQGRKDANFYTSDVPRIRDRQAALKVLLGRSDEVLEVETASGGETLVFPGYNEANDRDGDGLRDATAIRGFATAVGDSVLTDATRSWEPGALAGKRLSDSAGRAWSILDNDATSLRVAPEERLSFALNPRSRAFYVVDDPALDSRATAQSATRRALLLPAANLSDLNYAFRLLANGRHLPVLDGSSYRVLLTTSWLEPDEPQQNRLALATFNDQSFAALKDPTLIREWGNFDDTILIVGYATDKQVVSTGDMLGLTVYFKTLKLVKKSLKIFIHMDKAGGGARIAGDHWPLNPTRHSEDNKNCGGCYRTDHWLIGDIVKDHYEIEIPEGNPGEYTIWIGLYQPGPDTRLPVKTWDQPRVQHDGNNRLGLGTIRVK